MDSERLMDVVAVLEAVPDAQFDMGTWWLSDLAKFERRVPECGTAGCAVGHYIRARPECSLKLAKVHGTHGYHMPVCGEETELRNWDAVEHHFGLSEYQARYLFDSGAYSSTCNRQLVIARIKAFVADGGLVPEWYFRQHDEIGTFG